MSEALMTGAGGPEAAAAGHLLERARWAALAFGSYSAQDVKRVVTAVADAAHAQAGKYAEWAVRETGFGVVEHKVLKNEACSTGLVAEYAAEDFASPRVDAARKIVSVPRPAGVVLALLPSTNPIATLYFKVILALMTRNAIVVSPHPKAQQCSADAAELLARVALAAGAPDGVIQVIAEPTIPLVEAVIGDERTNLIVATGGTGVVRAAYRSGNPALGVGPGNVPVLVDRTADPSRAARLIVDSKAFDNSVLCTNESVLIVEEVIADRLSRELERNGAAVLDRAAADRLRAYMFADGSLNVAVVGKDASWIADQAGLRVAPRTRLLVAPFDVAVPEEMLAHEKLSPVLGMITVASADQGIREARAVIRIAGAGHSAAVHSQDPATVMAFAARVPVLRVTVNGGNSTGGSGIDTGLALSMTIGTGFVGGSSLGENLQPRHLLDWTRIAYNSDPANPLPDFSRVSPWPAHHGPVPRYPEASNARAGGPQAPSQRNPSRAAQSPPAQSLPAQSLPAQSPASAPPAGPADTEALRAEIRRLVLQELSHLMED